MISPSVPMPLPPHPETRKADGRGEPGARPRPGRPASPGGGILGRLMKPGHYRLRDQSRIIDSNGPVLAELENEGVLVAAHASDPLAVPLVPCSAVYQKRQVRQGVFLTHSAHVTPVAQTISARYQ